MNQRDQLIMQSAVDPTAKWAVDRIKQLEQALEPFARAAERAEEIIVPRTAQNTSEWLSAVIHHFHYRISYANLEQAKTAMAVKVTRATDI